MRLFLKSRRGCKNPVEMKIESFLEQKFMAWAPDVFWDEEEGKVLVFKLSRSQIALLDSEVAAVWRLCTGKKTFEQIVTQLMESEGKLEQQQLERIISNLVSRGLLTNEEEPVKTSHIMIEDDARLFWNPAVWAKEVGSEFTILDNQRGVVYEMKLPWITEIWSLTRKQTTVGEVLKELRKRVQVCEQHLVYAWAKIVLQILVEARCIILIERGGSSPESNYVWSAERRIPFVLQFHVTGKCNLHCKHCYEDGAIKDEMCIEEKLAVLGKVLHQVKIWDRVPRIVLTGGEPLASQHFWGLLDYLEQHLMQSGSTAVLSNGTLITAPIARRLSQYRTLRQIQISLDGATEETHDGIRGKGNFSKAVSAIENLKVMGIRVAIHFVVHKANYAEAFQMPELARKLRADYLLITRLVPWGRGKDMQDLMLTPGEVRELYLKLAEVGSGWQKEGKHETTIVNHRCDWPVIFSSDSDIENSRHWNGGSCRVGLSHITIMQDGTAYACRRLPIPIGNLRSIEFTELWDNDTLWELRRRDLFIQGKCRQCRFAVDPAYRFLCRGGATCIAYGFYGDPFQPDPQCDYDPIMGAFLNSKSIGQAAYQIRKIA